MAQSEDVLKRKIPHSRKETPEKKKSGKSGLHSRRKILYDPGRKD